MVQSEGCCESNVRAFWRWFHQHQDQLVEAQGWMFLGGEVCDERRIWETMDHVYWDLLVETTGNP